MIRAQRKLHAIVWPVLAVLLCALVAAALVTRARTDDAIAAAPHTEPR